MRLRLFAAVLLAPLALSGCDENPIGAGAPLVGGWVSDQLQWGGTAPNGSTNVRYREEWSFQDDGTYFHAFALVDANTGHAWVLHAEAGVWRATDDELRRTIRETFHVDDQAQAPEEPVLVPVIPELVRSVYDLEGATLTIVPPCPPGALCTPPLLLHRAQVAF